MFGSQALGFSLVESFPLAESFPLVERTLLFRLVITGELSTTLVGLCLVRAIVARDQNVLFQRKSFLGNDTNVCFCVSEENKLSVAGFFGILNKKNQCVFRDCIAFATTLR